MIFLQNFKPALKLFFKNTCTQQFCLFSEAHMGNSASQCANYPDFGPISLLGCLPLSAASVFTYLAGSLRALLQFFSASFKTGPQGV